MRVDDIRIAWYIYIGKSYNPKEREFTMFTATITVPSVQRDGSPVEDLAIVQNVCRKNLCEWFGGVTETVGKGSWVNSRGKIVTEEVTVFQTLTEDRNVLPILRGLAQHVQNVCNQESVLITVQGHVTVEFVELVE